MRRIAYALALLLPLLMGLQLVSASDRDLPNGPGYADIKGLRVVTQGNYYVLRLHLYGYLPRLNIISGRIYIDADSNSSTGCTWPFERGSDLLVLFSGLRAKVFRWMDKGFRYLANLSVGFEGDGIRLALPKTLLPKPRFKLWTTVTINDPFIPTVFRLRDLGSNYTKVLTDGMDELPGWLDLISVSAKLADGVLWLMVTYRSQPLPSLNGSSFEALAGVTIMVDADGNPRTGYKGAEYALTLQRLYSKRPLLELSINGKIDVWGGNRWRPLTDFPGGLLGNSLIYRIPLTGLNLSKGAMMIISGGGWGVLRDYYPDNYFRQGWVIGG